MPNYLVQWGEMIRWAIETGCRIYDFRGVSGYLDESNPLYGIYPCFKVKRRTAEFIGEMNLVIKPFYAPPSACPKSEKVYKKRTVVSFMKNEAKLGR